MYDTTKAMIRMFSTIAHLHRSSGQRSAPATAPAKRRLPNTEKSVRGARFHPIAPLTAIRDAGALHKRDQSSLSPFSFSFQFTPAPAGYSRKREQQPVPGDEKAIGRVVQARRARPSRQGVWRREAGRCRNIFNAVVQDQDQ